MHEYNRMKQMLRHQDLPSYGEAKTASRYTIPDNFQCHSILPSFSSETRSLVMDRQ